MTDHMMIRDHGDTYHMMHIHMTILGIGLGLELELELGRVAADVLV